MVLGRPLVNVDDLLLPDRAGVKMTFANWVTFVKKTIPKIPAFLHNTPSKVDLRIHDVCSFGGVIHVAAP